MKESDRPPTARRTYRTAALHAPDDAPANAADAVSARFGDRFYLRTAEEVDDARALPPGTEIFICTASDAATATRLAELLTGPGGIAAISGCTVADNDVLVELAHNFVLLFALIDTHEATLGRVRRRALLPLHDATLVDVAKFAWNTTDLHAARILEVAAGDPPW